MTINSRFVPDELGWAWAAHLQHHTCGKWLVLWEPGSQHFTAFYLGDTAEGGAYRKASTPRGLWERILAFDPSRPQSEDCEGIDAGGSSAWRPCVAGPEQSSADDRPFVRDRRSPR
ncbi:hypothetical protein ABZ897_46555 [Nonomuraea sp. NPDC046802]|uniref:hypothetical protein n=1 Tax=Nonomuraea sp. NPDC046802 TaxID=3154919 RepID=UPI0033C5B9BD